MIITSIEWDAFLTQHPDAHLLQMSRWGQLKSEFGWEAKYIHINNTGAQILFRKLPFGFTIGYIPKGPIGQEDPSFWKAVDQECQQNRAVFLKIEPDDEENRPIPKGCQVSPISIQPMQTIILDLKASEEQILAGMKQKTRYNIRLAQKKGVLVNLSANTAIFSQMMLVTGERDNFGVHGHTYYQRVYDLFHPIGMCELFIAEFDHQPLGGIMVFKRGKRAWYLYGASDNSHRNRMPNYLLQWEAIRWARTQGCTEYDLWGIPDKDEETLEEKFTSRTDGLWGVYRFKRGFGGKLTRWLGPWDRVYHPGLYKLYKWWIKYQTHDK